MIGIVDKILQIPNLYKLQKCSVAEVKMAQESLNLKFSAEYVDYVTNFGAISFYGTEFTGLNVKGYLNVVEATLSEREIHKDFPKDCYVIENLQMEGAVVISDAEGKIYNYFNETKLLICNNLVEYIEECIARNN